MLASLELPPQVTFERSTPPFDHRSVPPGLLRAHRVAAGVWGVLRVEAGTVRFVLEESGEWRDVHGGERQVIEPEVPHHVEPDDRAAFVVEFYR